MRLAPEQAELHLGLLDRCGYFAFQTLSDSHTTLRRSPDGKPYDPLARIFHGTLGQHLEALTRANMRGAGVHVMVNEGDGNGRRAANVVRVRVLFIDTDGAPFPADLPLTPHLVVESSPGRWHLYWLVEGVPLGEFAPLQGALAELYGTDPSITDLPRVMRLPGFYHLKGEPVPVRLVAARQHHPFSRGELFEAWPALAEAVRRRAEAEQARLEARRIRRVPISGAGDAQALAILHSLCETVAAGAEGSRHIVLRNAALTLGGYVGGGYLDAEAVTAALLEAAEVCGLPACEAEMVVRWGLERGAMRPLAPHNYRARVAARMRGWNRGA